MEGRGGALFGYGRGGVKITAELFGTLSREAVGLCIPPETFVQSRKLFSTDEKHLKE